ncbi:hypothetical protein GNI_127640 [Gregarina niphandrodes]|uniref:Uncharacterized protein n=1 Tax=Gregarina niphandrodes TaxID=110365 RepID=A0A023B1Y1_GRENI|nr:hypothetical protein GNI_127640 [Gregarina niphandrodes]EZG49017.1 hypothetical protein GNI_127640 [Gregarina niphandrodes]|eukprot:XP_011132058.1 hypothetical protein GNI_127640 [Gregarina niphandrodes]
MTSGQYTAFVSHRGVPEHTGMPLGAKNSAILLRQVMDRVFEETYAGVCRQDCWYGRHVKNVDEFGSKELDECQQRWDTRERELYATRYSRKGDKTTCVCSFYEKG